MQWIGLVLELIGVIVAIMALVIDWPHKGKPRKHKPH